MEEASLAPGQGPPPHVRGDPICSDLWRLLLLDLALLHHHLPLSTVSFSLAHNRGVCVCTRASVSPNFSFEPSFLPGCHPTSFPPHNTSFQKCATCASPVLAHSGLAVASLPSLWNHPSRSPMTPQSEGPSLLCTTSQQQSTPLHSPLPLRQVLSRQPGFASTCALPGR